MAIVFADKVKVRSYSTGTAEFTLETTVPGFQSFAAIGVGNECYYGIEDAAGNWEVGLGTYDTDSTQELLFRDTVISSSNSNILVNFPPGGKSVFVTIPSSVAANIISSTTFAFRDIEVAGQTTVSADSTTDTLTLVAGNGVTITTNASTDTITFDTALNELTSGSYGLELDTAGNVNYPGDITQSYQDSTLCPVGVDTVIYTSTGQYKHAIKLFVMVEGSEGAATETQACDIIAVRGYTDNIISVTAYGIVYSGTAALATFDGQWNATTSRIEITCQPISLTDSVTVSVHAIEMNTNAGL